MTPVSSCARSWSRSRCKAFESSHARYRRANPTIPSFLAAEAAVDNRLIAGSLPNIARLGIRASPDPDSDPILMSVFWQAYVFYAVVCDCVCLVYIYKSRNAPDPPDPSSALWLAPPLCLSTLPHNTLTQTTKHLQTQRATSSILLFRLFLLCTSSPISYPNHSDQPYIGSRQVSTVIANPGLCTLCPRPCLLCLSHSVKRHSLLNHAGLSFSSSLRIEIRFGSRLLSGDFEKQHHSPDPDKALSTERSCLGTSHHTSCSCHHHLDTLSPPRHLAPFPEGPVLVLKLN